MQTYQLTLSTSWDRDFPTRKEVFLNQYPTSKDRLELYKLSFELLGVIIAVILGIKQLLPT